MPDAQTLEDRATNNADALAGRGAASPIRVEALKELTLALLREVESLEGEKPRDVKQKICLQDEVRRFEADLIRCALARTGGHQRRAARLLGIKITTLNAKIKRYGIDPDAPPTAPGNVVDLYPDGQRRAG